jgi:hypothetical protein
MPRSNGKHLLIANSYTLLFISLRVAALAPPPPRAISDASRGAADVGQMVKVEETQSTPTVEFMAVTASDVAQNLQAFKNKGPGNKTGSGNTVGSSLQCFENDLPFTSAGNVAKQAQGQCTAAPLAPLAMSLLFSGDPTGPVVVQQD